jgi:hypothetical protein
MRRTPTFPPDTWPPRMTAEMAAGYVGERHVEDFLERVGTIYPAARWTESQKRKFWYRADLDNALGITAAPSAMGAKFNEAVREKRGG